MEKEYIFNIINESIDETLGINNEVLIKSNELTNLIVNKINNKISSIDKYTDSKLFNNYFNFVFNGNEIRVIYYCMYFKNNNTYKNFVYKNPYYNLEDCSSNYSTNFKSEITVNFYAIGNKINKESLSMDIYHELNHLLEQQQMKKRYALYKNNNFILKNIHSSNKMKYYISWILYLNDKSEQTAFSNSVINALFNHEPYMPKNNIEIRKVIENTQIFKQLNLLLDSKLFIENNKENASLILKEINLSVKELLKKCDEDIENIRYKLGRTITFYKEYIQTHGCSRFTTNINQINESINWFYYI